MKDNIYTVERLCRELDQPRQKIRRRLIKLDIKAINEDTRAYKNVPLEYDDQAFFMLVEEFNLSVSRLECTTNVQQDNSHEEKCTTENGKQNKDELNKDKLIKILEEQLKESNKSRENLEKLLDQQQQLTLISNRKLEVLKLEVEEEKKSKWYNVFKRKK